MTPNVPVEALPRIVQSLATELAVSPRQVDAAVALLDEGATVPFIARYRKEATGNLDDTQLRTLEERLVYLREKGELPETTTALADAVRGAYPPAQRHGRIHPATRTFQAFRIHVNGELDPNATRVRPLRQVRASYAAIRASHLAPLGLLAMVISQAAMTSVMTMTPSHMKDHGNGSLSAYVIALHIAGMYAFAPFVGRFVGWAGKVRAVMVGAVVLGLGTVVAVVAGYVPSLIFVGLFLLGVGWNIGLIAGSAILTGAVPAESRVEVQGAADLTMSFCGGLAAFGSGFVKQAWGYHLLADAATLLAGVLLVAGYAQSLRNRVSARAASC